MSYALPDEPRGAVRPDLAVAPIWPLLTLMIAGPLAGFAWLAFNSWALGCRVAWRHTVIGVLAVPALGVSTILIAALMETAMFGADTSLVARLLLVFAQSAAMLLAFWIVWDQSDAEEWRKTFGDALANGAPVFVVLLLIRIFLAPYVPIWAYIFVFWAPGA